MRWCEARLRKAHERETNITLAEYAEGFWRPDAPFALDRAAHGRAVTNGYLDISEGYTRKHLLPKWGSLELRDLSVKAIDEWIVELHRCAVLAPATINKILQCLRTILDRAVVDGCLSDNPASLVKPVRVPRSEREILTPAEASRLLASPQAWSDFRQYAINVLAATTGMRMGEIRGLRVEDVNPDHVQIRLSWEQGYGLKAPKCDSARDVPLSPRVFEILSRVIQETRPKTILFYGRKGMDTPLAKSCIEGNLSTAMQWVGIPPVEQRRRNLGFHGWRHFLNTMLLSRGVPDAKVRKITGHRSQKMSDRYTHFRVSDFQEVADLQRELLEAPAAVG